MFRTHLEIPSQLVVDIELGEVFEDCGKRYILLYRDPWKAKIARFTWADRLLVKLVEKLRN